MTVGQLKKFLRKIDNDIDVIVSIDEDNFMTVCPENSQIIDIELEDENKKLIPKTFLLIAPCDCDEELLLDGEINSQPELN